MLILIFDGETPESIRHLRSFSSTDSTLRSHGDNCGFMDTPGTVARFFLLDKIFETSMARANRSKIGRCLDSEYLPRRMVSLMGSVEISGLIFLTTDEHLLRSFSSRLFRVVPFSFSGMP